MNDYTIDDLRLQLVAQLASETGEEIGPNATFAEVKWVMASHGIDHSTIDTPGGMVAVADLFPEEMEGE